MRIPVTVVALLVSVLGWQANACAADGPRYDVVIRGGRIVDGSGAPWYQADIGIQGEKIAHIGRIDAADGQRVIDAAGLVVAPGFVDMMGQSASPMLEDPRTALNLLTQGITTINAGEGSSAAPLSESEGRGLGYTTMAEYFTLVDAKGLPVNVVQTVGHTQVRQIVLGDVDRRPSDEELMQMQELVREGMQAGAIGVSTALIYPPAVYAPTQEIAALAKTAGDYGGRYYTHMRNEGDRLLEAIDEAIEIGREGGTPVHIFHLKAAGQQNWGKLQLAIARIQAARAEGQQVAADIYPYINNGLGISALIHPRHFAQGRDHFLSRLEEQNFREEIRQEMETTEGWENWFRHANHDWNRIIVGRSNEERYRQFDGLSVAAMATEMQEDPWDTFFNLVRSGAFALPQTMSEANKILALQQEFVSFCTDVGPSGGGRAASHPRAFGSFPRLLSKYVRDLGVLSLERAIAQASAVAANEVLAYDRGRIAVGLVADLVVFDYQRLADRADFKEPHAPSEGVMHVLVNGQLVLEDGEFTGKRPGRVLRGPGFDPAQAAHQLATGPDYPGFEHYDRSMNEFLRKHRIPGAAIAVTDNGRLVFARGYGLADVAQREPVTPDSLFRVASLSKPITAVAILQLIVQGKLGLDDKFLEILDYSAEIDALGEDFDTRLRDVTIRHLLEHRGGWDRDESFDPMFQSVRFAQQFQLPPPANQATIIRAMLSQPLDFNPGERYAYSNFGYCLLGRIVEKLTGQTYEAYVQQHVLAPLGIETMRIGATRLAGRADREVRYYHPDKAQSVFEDDLAQTTPSPYGGWYLEAMDSHGGWLASAVDLAKFAAAFDKPDQCPILSPQAIDWMYQRPPGLAGYTAEGEEKATYYSLGWNNRVVADGQRNHWHTGSLPGTATIMIRRHDGKNFIGLLNSRVSPTDTRVSGELDALLHRMANAVTEWPE